MKKIFIYAYEKACGKRLLDANKIRTYFSKNGHKIVNNPKDADVIIFITCAVFKKSAEDSLDGVKEFQDKYDAELIVAGCFPAIDKEELAKIFDGRTLSTKDLDDIDRLFPENKIKFRDVEDANIYFQNLDKGKPVKVIKDFFRNIRWIESTYVRLKDHVLKNLFVTFNRENSLLYGVFTDMPKSIYYIRVSWGCMSNCSYCAIKNAIGTFKSKPIDQCIKEFKDGLNEGYKDFVIVGDIVGPYGLDIGSSFPELLDKMTKIPGDYEISIRAFGPQWAIKYVDDLEKILQRRKIIGMDMSIQSGSSRILKLMNRYYDTEKMKAAFLRLKRAHSDLSSYTQGIVGFPTETEEEFKETLYLIKELDFSKGSINPFSPRPGTKAENMEPKIPQKEISKRLRYAKKFLKKEGYNVHYMYLDHIMFSYLKKE